MAENNQLKKSNFTSISESGIIRDYPVTLFIIISSIIIFILFKYEGGNINARIKYGWGSGYLIWQGEIWRLFLNPFHHADYSHLLINMGFIAYLGRLAESHIGKIKYLLFILFTGFFQSVICEITIEPGAIGMSGVVYGLFGLLLIIRKGNEQILKAISQTFIKIMVYSFFALLTLTILRFIPVANIAHFSGFLIGIIYSYCCQYKTNLAKQFIFIIFSILLISAALYAYIPLYNHDWQIWILMEKPEPKVIYNNENKL